MWQTPPRRRPVVPGEQVDLHSPRVSDRVKTLSLLLDQNIGTATSRLGIVGCIRRNGS
jgi:hypothetical protein